MRKLESFKGIHAGQSAVVCGCGVSAAGFRPSESLITIGLSDIGRLFDPTYLMVSNYLSQYPEHRREWILTSKARYIFTTLKYIELTTDNVVFCEPLKFAGTSFDRSDALNYSSTSAYAALCLAVHLGANPIGLLGVDFNDHHFFGETGAHPLSNELLNIQAEFATLNSTLRSKGVDVYNLSATSRLTAFRNVPLSSFLGVSKAERAGIHR